MFFKYTVPVPVAAGKISRQKTKSGTYILYVISRQYDPAKKHTTAFVTMPMMSSVATCIFMPKCHVFPFLPLDISGSRL